MIARRKGLGAALTAVGLACASLVAGTATDAVAQGSGSGTYVDVLAAPDDLDTNMRFLNTQLSVGDFEGAVVTLQRLLLLNPNFDRARLLRAAAFLRLGDERAAEVDLRFLANRPLSEADRRQADRLQARVNSDPGAARLFGTIRAGVLYESNVDLGPGSGTLGGNPFNFSGNDAVGGFGQASLFAEVPFVGGSGHAFIAEASAMVRGFDDADGHSYGTLAAGPRFDFGAGTIDLLALAGVDFLGSDHYAHTLGGRARLTVDVTDRVEAGFVATAAHQSIDVGVLSPANVGDADGYILSVRPTVTYRFSDTWRVVVHGYAADKEADNAWYSYTAFGGGLALHYRNSEGISFRLGGLVRDLDFDAADPRFSAGVPARDDTRYTLDVALSVPFSEIALALGGNPDEAVAPLWALETFATYSVNQSNIAIYDNAGWTFGLAIARRFSL